MVEDAMSHMQSMKCAVPRDEAMVVEFPGLVRNLDTAVKMVGGIAALTEVVNGRREFLTFKFRPGDPFSHGLTSYKEPTKGFIMALSRPADSGPDTRPEEVEISLAAQVNSTFTFRGLADYQYVPHHSSPSAADAAAKAQELVGMDPQPLHCTPTLFSKVDVPQEYDLQPYHHGDTTLQPPVFVRRNRTRPPAFLANFHTHAVPSPLPPSATACHLVGARLVLLGAAAAALEEQPVWAPGGLAAHLEGPALADLQYVVPRAAYMFRNGPWRGLWVRRGYDPRTDPASRMWQAAEIGTPAPRPAATAAEGAWGGQLLSEVGDKGVQDALAAGDVGPACTFEEGWWSRATWQRLCQLLHGEAPAPANPAGKDAPPPAAEAARGAGAEEAGAAAPAMVADAGQAEVAAKAATAAAAQPPPGLAEQPDAAGGQEGTKALEDAILASEAAGASAIGESEFAAGLQRLLEDMQVEALPQVDLMEEEEADEYEIFEEPGSDAGSEGSPRDA